MTTDKCCEPSGLQDAELPGIVQFTGSLSTVEDTATA